MVSQLVYSTLSGLLFLYVCLRSLPACTERHARPCLDTQLVSTMAYESSKTSPTEGQDGPNNELNIRLLSSSADIMLTWAGRFIDAAQVLFCLFCDFTYCGLSYAHCPLLPSGMMGHDWTPSWYTQLCRERYTSRQVPRRANTGPTCSSV